MLFATPVVNALFLISSIEQTMIKEKGGYLMKQQTKKVNKRFDSSESFNADLNRINRLNSKIEKLHSTNSQPSIMILLCGIIKKRVKTIRVIMENKPRDKTFDAKRVICWNDGIRALFRLL